METLNTEKAGIAKSVESRQEKLWKISDAIWSYVELVVEAQK